MLFSLTDVERHITPDSFMKGMRLFTGGMVTAPNIQRGGELITAIIPQPGHQPLRIYVRTGRNKNKISIDGECSCTNNKNCQHVAAVLLQALDDQQALHDDGDLAPPTTSDKTANKKGPKKSLAAAKLASQAKTLHVLLYTLQLDETGLLIETNVARRLRRGGYSITCQFEPNRATSRTPARFLQPIDLEILSALDRSLREPDTGLPRLDGPQSAHRLEVILGTGRCYFEDAEWGTPLRIGPPRSLEIQWLTDDFGYQLAAHNIKPEANFLLPLSCPWYLETGKGECGPLNSDMQPDLIYELMAFPPVAPEQAHKVQKALGNAFHGSPIPALQKIEIKTAPRVKPVPCLRLATIENQADGDMTEYYDIATLSFDYGNDNHGNDNHGNNFPGIEINRHNPPTRFKDGQLIRVQRDKKAEKAAVKQLYKLGFEENETWNRHTGDDCFFLSFDFMDGDFEEHNRECWFEFQLEDAPTLQAQGWRIKYDNFRYQLAEASNWVCDVDKLEKQDWFSIGLGVEVDGQRIDLLPILLEFLNHFPNGLPDKEKITAEYFIVPFTITNEKEANEKGTDEKQHHQERMLRLPVARILPLLETLLEIYDGTAVVDKQRLRLSRIQLTQLTALDQNDTGPRLHWLANDEIQQLTQRLRDLDTIPEVAPPSGLIATLRDYQQQGLNWLQFLREFQLAGILADDMGLGKTVQALAHLLLEKEAGRADRPSLVVAPTSLMFNWRHEVERFTPQLKVLILQGPQRQEKFSEIANHDLILTTYPLLSRDKESLLAHEYHLLILDEAQIIKNPKAQASQVVREINARHRLCLTGTPLENHLGELWSLFDFLLPGLLGNSKQFRRIFRTPIEKNGNEATSERLSRRLRPFLLRRTKQQVATELPPKTQIIQSVALEDKQRELYETVRLAMHRRVREEIERQGLSRSHIVVLDALLKLRQVCCDPRLVKIDKAREVKQSAKLDMLMQLLPEMVEEGRRILVFSQFTTMLGLIEDELKKANIRYVKLTGQTRDRQTPVQQFQDGKVPLFLISLKAGGLGLNLTAADTVIHYDPWWNPAVERQATDRAHRIGQQQAVFVYKLICEGTVEEKIQAMQQRKQALADGLFLKGESLKGESQKGDNQKPLWNEQDLAALFGALGED